MSEHEFGEHKYSIHGSDPLAGCGLQSENKTHRYMQTHIRPPLYTYDLVFRAFGVKQNLCTGPQLWILLTIYNIVSSGKMYSISNNWIRVQFEELKNICKLEPECSKSGTFLS